MQEQLQQVRDRVELCIRRAREIYNVDLPPVEVVFDLRSRAAGRARRIRGQYSIQFNPTHIQLGGKTWQHLLMDTVPHEVAHLVCFFQPSLGRNHDRGWQRVCRALGGKWQDSFF